MPKRKEPFRLDILQQIFENFQQITQWLPDSAHLATEYAYKAEVLIELLEVVDCGQVGGYDKDNPTLGECSYSLYDRFIALCDKYNHRKEIKESCDADVDTLKHYFNCLDKLREIIYNQFGTFKK